MGPAATERWPRDGEPAEFFRSLAARIGTTAQLTSQGLWLREVLVPLLRAEPNGKAL